MKVYIANFAGHNYEAATKYGELKFITMGFISFQSLERVMFQVVQGLKNSCPEDYLALSGTNIINALATVVWFQKHGLVKILNYDKTTSNYRSLFINPSIIGSLLEGVARGTDYDAGAVQGTP